MRKRIAIPKRTLLIAVAVLVGIGFLFTLFLNFRLRAIGREIGSNAGSMAGRAVGTFNGIITGRTEGLAAGKEAGLSAEDTAVRISDSLQDVSNLEVLVASVKLSNCHKIGEKIDYAALYLVNGELVFTVDLSQAVAQANGEDLEITLPKPEGKLYLDNSTLKKAAEYQRTYFTGSAEAGFDAFLNTMAKVQEASEETITNYDSLLVSAREAAKDQVTRLAESVSAADHKRNISVIWAS